MEDSKYTLMNYQTVLRFKLYIITICENLAKGKYFKSLKKFSKATYFKLSKNKKMILKLSFPKIQTFKKVTAEQIWFVCSQYLLRIN
jgi:hypothetical protein